MTVRTRAAAGLVLAVMLITACSGGGSPDHPRHQDSPAAGSTSPANHRHPERRRPRVLMPAVSPSCHPGVNAAEWWMVSHRQLRVLERVAPGALRHAIAFASLLVLGAPDRPARVGQPVAVFKSYADLRRAIAAARIPRRTHWVLYDNERWPATPVREQKRPGQFETLFARLAHRHGYRVILAPGQDLALGFSRTHFARNIAAWRRYLSLGLPAISARLADIYEIQAQPFELPAYRHQRIFLADVQEAVTQARVANPHAIIFAGISTQRVTRSSDLFSDFMAVRGLVAGFWLNLPHYRGVRQQRFARQFLSRIPGAAAATGRTCARSLPARPATPARP